MFYLIIFFQVTSALVAFRHYLRRTCKREIVGNGVFDNNPLHDAAVRHHVNSLLPVEDEQRTRLHHVYIILRLCGSVADVRIQILSVSRLEAKHHKSSSPLL